jgi:RNA polymerase sigma-70 factor (ECF subfamily)
MNPDAMDEQVMDEAEPTAGRRRVAPVQQALRDGLRRFVARRARPEDVDDLVQDVLLRMHERAADLQDEARLAAWALRVAQSVVADHHRRKRPEVAEDAAPEPADVEEAGNVNEIVASWLRPMIALLPDEYEEAIELVDVAGMSQREYAERAGLSPSGARTRVQRGRRMLEEIVRACCELETDARGNVIAYEPRACACAPGEPSGPDRRAPRVAGRFAESIAGAPRLRG